MTVCTGRRINACRTGALTRFKILQVNRWLFPRVQQRHRERMTKSAARHAVSDTIEHNQACGDRSLRLSPIRVDRMMAQGACGAIATDA